MPAAPLKPLRSSPRLPLASLALAACILLGAGPAAQAKIPGDFYGLTSEDAWERDRDYRTATFSAQASAGVGVVRQVFHWNLIEPAPGEYDLSAYDAYVLQAAQAGLEVLPVLSDPPAFRSSAPKSGAKRGVYPPRRPGDMAAFAATLVRRYGPTGTLWSERPDAARMPIRAWQVWNEPWLAYFWPDGPDAAQYTELLRQVGQAIRAADPGAEIVAAGSHPNAWIADMYRAGARGTFDTLARHSYSHDSSQADLDEVIDELYATRRIMDRYGDGGKIWVTEFGWATDGPPSPLTVDEPGQAIRIKRTLEELTSRRRELGLRGLIYYNWIDRKPWHEDFWGVHTGLHRIDGQPKPGFYALRNTIATMHAREALRAQEPGGPPQGGPGAGRRSSGYALVEVSGSGVVTVRVACPGAGSPRCRGTLEVVVAGRGPARRRGPGARRERLGARRFRVRSGRVGRARLRLARPRMMSGRHLALEAIVVARSRSGAIRRARIPFRVTLPPRSGQRVAPRERSSSPRLPELRPWG